MSETWDQDRIQKLIDDQIEESLTLEYKGKDSLGKSDGKKKEITKDVSAMANSAGGTLIYGVREYEDSEGRKLPKEIEPIDPSQFSSEWLQQVINNIRPRIESPDIVSVSVETDQARGIVYVIDIAQGTTAHQAQDHKYYKRYNSLNVPMEDYEIQLVMARIKHPKIEIELTTLHGRGIAAGLLLVEAKNAGHVYANYVNCSLDIPEKYLASRGSRGCVLSEGEDGRRFWKVSLDNTASDFTDLWNRLELENLGSTVQEKVSLSRSFYPILPGVTAPLGLLLLGGDFNLLRTTEISWIVHADNAKPIKGEVPCGDIRRKL